MNASCLDDRIRSVRIGLRANQPLPYRINLVRKLHAKQKKTHPQGFEVYQNNNQG